MTLLLSTCITDKNCNEYTNKTMTRESRWVLLQTGKYSATLHRCLCLSQYQSIYFKRRSFIGYHTTENDATKTSSW